ncbi:DUF397 domain-containing protein [Streptomyces brevispora]|uniref:DUF397 domain-containing protein n=1 Tax=Streptomyces brevispora TaxID=887462 RepID=A0ABZ1GD45_9ACTN|nr:DUF397 domain-containing protein [Streptomyces brevispora]WSC17888.1 DUF397 domain-containing protein [Streptomyces brevispora]
MAWSCSNGGACIEVAANLATTRGIVPVRDSEDLRGPALGIPVNVFASFVAGVKAGEFGTV